MMRLFAGIMLIGLLLASNTHAQWYGRISIESGYDDNMFRNYSAVDALSSDFSFMYGYFPTDANFAINYSGSLTTFSEYPERLYTTHTLGSSYALTYGENANNTLTLLVAGNARFDRQDYEIYDYRQVLGSASLKHQLFNNLPLLLSYRARHRSYPYFGELSYLEHFASIGTMAFFETRTSIRVQADLGIKNYSSSFRSATDPGIDGFMADGSGLTLEGGGPGGNGNGGNNDGGSNSGGSSSGGGPLNSGGAGRMGINHGGQQLGMEQGVEYLMYDDPSTAQLSAWINIGQSVTEFTGLSLRLLQRWNLTDRGRAFVGGAVDFIGEEELFDDPYSYESSELSLTLTQILPWSMKLRTGGFYLFKEYDYPATLDYSDPAAALRSDDRMGGWLTVEKTIGGKWLLFSGLDLSLGYVYLRNQSNTSYYDYSSNALTFGIRTNL
ncbi:MAG: hypothetical protein JXA28_10875 [Bacteroidetes bacterium]|nr:hypothetical protein [Bacteroidota bacterium]